MGLSQIFVIALLLVLFVRPKDIPDVISGIKKALRAYRSFRQIGQNIVDQLASDTSSIEQSLLREKSKPNHTVASNFEAIDEVQNPMSLEESVSKTPEIGRRASDDGVTEPAS